MKYCKTCDQTLSFDLFYNDKRSKDGLRHQCKQCEKARNVAYYSTEAGKATMRKMVLSRHNISSEFYNNKLKDQEGVCAICAQYDKMNNVLQVDHCHLTNKIRGLLCNKCNKALGFLDDDIVRLQHAIEYLRKWSS